MFRLLQIDAETAAMHINCTALQKHAEVDRLWETVDAFFDYGPSFVLSGLMSENDSTEKFNAVALFSSLLHEVRHYVDLILTPFGFYRLRTAFECYVLLSQLVVSEEVKQIPIPLMSGASKVNQRMLGLSNYEGSRSEQFSKYLQSRADVICEDNQRHGGDAVLEALAFSIQAELALSVFRGDEYEKRMPYLYGSIGGTSPKQVAFNSKYRWHYAMAHRIDDNADAGTMAIVYWILFASLCGPLNEGERVLVKGLEDWNIQNTLQKFRLMDDAVPSGRLRKLYEYFERSAPKIDKTAAFNIVNEASVSLFGRGIVEELEIDIRQDKALIERLKDASDFSSRLAIDSFFAFEDLVTRREALVAEFKQNPSSFISPVPFIKRLTPEKMPHVILNYPHGLLPQDLETGHEIITDQTWEIPVIVSDCEESVRRERRLYSVLRPTKSQKICAKESWLGVYSVLAPSYKVMLYGRRYRSMLELDIMQAGLFGNREPKAVWDPIYASPDDVSEADEYYRFYGLNLQNCDICSRPSSISDTRYVSAATMRGNSPFVEEFQRTQPAIAVVLLLFVDYSGWVVCRQCGSRYKLW